MDLDCLQALIAVSRHETLAAAADSLHIGASALRRRISELETAVGAPLLTRQGRSVALTPSGQVLAREGDAFAARCQRLVTQVREDATGVIGEYRVAAQQGMQLPPVAGILSGHLARFPNLRLRLLPVPEPIALLPERADVAITLDARPLHGQWLTTVFHRLPERVVATRSYLSRHGTPRSIEQLREHRLLSWIPPGENPGDWPLLAGGVASVEPTVTSPDIQLMHLCMRAHMGLARLPVIPNNPNINSGTGADQVVPVLAEIVGRELLMRIVVPDTERMRGPFRRFFASVRSGVDEIF